MNVLRNEISLCMKNCKKLYFHYPNWPLSISIYMISILIRVLLFTTLIPPNPNIIPEIKFVTCREMKLSLTH